MVMKRTSYHKDYYKKNQEKLKSCSIINRNKLYLLKEEDITYLLSKTTRRRTRVNNCKLQKIIKHTTLYFN